MKTLVIGLGVLLLVALGRPAVAPHRPSRLLRSVTAKQYSELVWRASTPAPLGKGKRASQVAIDSIAWSGIVSLFPAILLTTKFTNLWVYYF